MECGAQHSMFAFAPKGRRAGGLGRRAGPGKGRSPTELLAGHDIPISNRLGSPAVL